MKIAFISTMAGPPWGGSEELWSQTAMRMAQQGFTVGVSIEGRKNEAKQISDIEKSGCVVVRRYNNRIQRLVSRVYPNSAFEFLEKFSPELVVISQGGNSDGLSWMEACIAKNITFVVISQAVSESFWPNDELAESLAKAYSMAKCSYFVSRANLQITQRQMAIALENAKVIRNPFNVSYDTKVQWPHEDEIFKLACVARLDLYAKGQDLLFELLSTDKWKSRPIQVSLFSSSGLNQKSLYKLKQLWNLQNVTFSGFTNDIEGVWEKHHALILPSRYEGLPLALVEAMLCARPCIVTDVGGNGELIEDGVSGFIAVAPKVEYLDEALERAWQQRTSWCKIGRNAAARVRELVPRDPVGVFIDELKYLLQ
jgi:glycosyltransferase involved in cell wall biosynthesis